jgi:putative membrane protein
MQARPPQVLALVASGIGVLAVGIVLAGFLEFGPHARHMAAHILAMNVAAPVVAAMVLARWNRPTRGASLLWFATFVQIGVLWVWHAPAAQNLILNAPSGMIIAHLTLSMAAMVFWVSLFSLTGASRLTGPSRWQAIPALLLTGKLVCLLAVLLVFAPRTLYGAAAHAAHGLGDQQLAGLLMLAACPLSYLVVAVFMTVHLIGADEPPRAPSPIQRTAS